MRAWLLTIAAACRSSNCYGGTCDYWDGGYWGTCAKLEGVYGCDCSGCECDGCPQGSCDDPPFDPIQCPGSGNAQCEAQYNTAECGWDGGDCCEETCVGVLCGGQGFDCKADGQEVSPCRVPSGIRGGVDCQTAFVQQREGQVTSAYEGLEPAEGSGAVEKVEKHAVAGTASTGPQPGAGGPAVWLAAVGAVAVLAGGLLGLRAWQKRQSTAGVRVPKQHQVMEAGAVVSEKAQARPASDALETASTATPDSLGQSSDLEEAFTTVEQPMGETTVGS